MKINEICAPAAALGELGDRLGLEAERRSEEPDTAGALFPHGACLPGAAAEAAAAPPIRWPGLRAAHRQVRALATDDVQPQLRRRHQGRHAKDVNDHAVVRAVDDAGEPRDPPSRCSSVQCLGLVAVVARNRLTTARPATRHYELAQPVLATAATSRTSLSLTCRLRRYSTTSNCDPR